MGEIIPDPDVAGIPNLQMVASDGTNLYATLADNSVWIAKGVVPLVWTQLPPIPGSGIPTWLGTTFGVLTPPAGKKTQHMFVVVQKGLLWSWDGTSWNAQHPPP
jgi:hypothetical protein